MPSTMVLSHLKAATRSHHEQIGDNPAATAIFTGHLSLEAYRAYLGRFFGFYAPVEQAIARLDPWPVREIDRVARAKTPLLVADLEWLGWDEGDLAALARCRDLPDLGSIPRALGCMYVLEGSTLGGQLIQRRLQEVLGLNALGGVAFFSSYGPLVGAMWKTFGAALESYGATHGQNDLMAAAACETFEKLDRWLRGS